MHSGTNDSGERNVPEKSPVLIGTCTHWNVREPPTVWPSVASAQMLFQFSVGF